MAARREPRDHQVTFLLRVTPQLATYRSWVLGLKDRHAALQDSCIPPYSRNHLAR